METKDKIEFEISGEQLENVKKFRKQHRNCVMGTVADRFEYTFIPTSMGLAASIGCSCGRSMPIGDFMDIEHKEYDSDKYGVLTEKEKENSEFEEAAKRILFLRNPQHFRMAFRQAITFELLYTYVIGLSVYADRRIRESILYKYDIDKYHKEILNYKDFEESKKIERFFKHFIKSVKKEVGKYDCKDQKLLQYLNDKTIYNY